MYSFTVNNDEDREQRASRGQRDGQESFFSGRERHDDTRAERGAERETEREKSDLTKYQIRQIFSNFLSPRVVDANKNERRRRRRNTRVRTCWIYDDKV